MLTILIRTILIYLILLFVLRIMGKRQIGELDLTELVITLMLSELAVEPITDGNIPLLYALIPILTLISLEILISFAETKSVFIKNILPEKPNYLIERGVLNQKELEKQRITMDELLCELRLKDISDIGDVYYAILERNGKLSGDQFVVKTIVTTDLIQTIATDFNVECKEVLTGFKYIAEAILKNEGQKQYVVGGEESYGYLVGDFVRDKDAVSACCLIAEMAAYHLATGTANHKLLAQVLEDIYKKHGYYKEDLLSLTKTGKAGVEEIQQMMANYRNNPPKELGGIPVVMMKDYAVSKSYDFVNKTNTIIDLPTSNVLQFFTADGCKVTVRPSGTEPKIKFYFSVVTTVRKRGNIAEEEEGLNEKIEMLKKDILLS